MGARAFLLGECVIYLLAAGVAEDGAEGAAAEGWRVLLRGSDDATAGPADSGAPVHSERPGEPLRASLARTASQALDKSRLGTGWHWHWHTLRSYLMDSAHLMDLTD